MELNWQRWMVPVIEFQLIASIVMKSNWMKLATLNWMRQVPILLNHFPSINDIKSNWNELTGTGRSSRGTKEERQIVALVTQFLQFQRKFPINSPRSWCSSFHQEDPPPIQEAQENHRPGEHSGNPQWPLTRAPADLQGQPGAQVGNSSTNWVHSSLGRFFRFHPLTYFLRRQNGRPVARCNITSRHFQFIFTPSFIIGNL